MGLGKFTATRLSVCSKIRCTDNRFASVFGSSNVVTLSRDLTRQLRTDCAFDVLRQLVNSFGIWAFNPLEHSLELNAGVAERQRLPPSCKSTGTPPLRSRSRSGGRHRAFLFYRHPASVPCASFSASCRKRRSAHDARSPLGRCGAVCVRKASLRLPCARSLRPGERGVGLDGSASRLPCRVRRVASCHRALSCGDIHVAACSVITPGWRHRAEDSDDILSSLRSTVHNQRGAWSASSRREWRASCPPTKKAISRWPRKASFYSGASGGMPRKLPPSPLIGLFDLLTHLICSRWPHFPSLHSGADAGLLIKEA